MRDTLKTLKYYDFYSVFFLNTGNINFFLIYILDSLFFFVVINLYFLLYVCSLTTYKPILEEARYLGRSKRLGLWCEIEKNHLLIQHSFSYAYPRFVIDN